MVAYIYLYNGSLVSEWCNTPSNESTVVVTREHLAANDSFYYFCNYIVCNMTTIPAKDAVLNHTHSNISFQIKMNHTTRCTKQPKLQYITLQWTLTTFRNVTSVLKLTFQSTNDCNGRPSLIAISLEENVVVLFFTVRVILFYFKVVNIIYYSIFSFYHSFHLH